MDTDTLGKCIFHSENHPPLVGRQDVPPTTKVFVPVFAYPDMMSMARFIKDSMSERQGQESGEEWMIAARRNIRGWFESTLTISHVTVAMSERWCGMAVEPFLHPNCTRDHLWVVACAQVLRQDKYVVTLVSENPAIYLAYQQGGYLNDIRVLEKNWDDLWDPPQLP